MIYSPDIERRFNWHEREWEAVDWTHSYGWANESDGFQHEFHLLKVRPVGRKRVLNTVRLNKRNWGIEDAAFEAIYG